ncbi:cysteine--tRNA ligase [Candidatus Pacearchaeota archaeon]|nr:cysteine--tRNA ligase [Candidatus Pacearchaeota archaeon]
MGKLYLYNSLTRKKEEFKPIKKGQVGMYTCGPTVYWYQHIGNFRTMLLNDFLRRTLGFLGYKVKHVMNITDVDDKTIKASQKEGITLKALTSKYEKIFFNDLLELNILRPTIVSSAVDSIPEMVEMIKKLIDKGYAYKSEDGVYFSISKFKNYGKLAQLEKSKKTKARVRSDEYGKENSQDFALWKFYTPEDGDVFWETEIGKGRPGWHIECSAMGISNLGESFDIHTGGVDLLFPHHTNEIAQSETATGKKFVNYWIHGGLVTMKEGKMSKSLGNILTLDELKKQGYESVHYRYYCLQTHYRKPLAFTFEGLDAARSAYERVRRKVIEMKMTKHKGSDKSEEYRGEFEKALYDDMNIPAALQVFLKTLDDDAFESKKRIEMIEHMDSVLGLGISEMKEEKIDVPEEVQKLVDSRERLRKNKMWAESDIIRQRILEKGYRILDTPHGPKVEKA